jgi:phosphinothricin acetyltransferase
MLGESHISVKANVTSASVIGQMSPSDWEQVRAIYLEGIATGNATFETEAPSWRAWNSSHLPFARLVARFSDLVAGWAALSLVSQRCVYGGVAEVSVYVSQTHRHEGIGRQLLSALISESERNGIWTLQAGMFPENAGSLALHQRLGFREVGRRERIGKLNGVWRDTILLERRSSLVGIE